MSVLSKRLLPKAVSEEFEIRSAIAEWRDSGFCVPSPVIAKRAVLNRYGIAFSTWVETGTYLGETTAMIAKFAPKVFTIEPADSLFLKAQARFKGNENVHVLHGTSEAVFPELLPKLAGDVTFWLDGHYSGGETFQGQSDSPLWSELEEISNNIGGYGNTAVLVDDIRFCGPTSDVEYSGYPTLDELVDWSRRNGMQWIIEHDIFIARKKF